jgi:hypothetical protein
MSDRKFTWMVPVLDGVELLVTAELDGVVTLAAEPAGPARLNHWHRAALVAVLDDAGRTAAGLLARREREAGR